MPIYAVTGASGQLGRLAVEELLAADVPASEVVALVRDASKVAGFAHRGVRVREADYSRPQTLDRALEGIDRLLLVSSSDPAQRPVHHTNVIGAASRCGVARIVYTSMLNADDSANPLVGDHRDTERVLRDSGIAFTSLRNGWYTENFTQQLSQYLEAGEIVGAAADGRISAATREDHAAAAVAALLCDEDGNRTYELGGPAFDLTQLAQVISEVTGTKVAYRDLPEADYAGTLQQTGLDEGAAGFVAALDASIARGELETGSEDLAHLLRRQPTAPAEVVRRAYDLFEVNSGRATIGLIGVGNIGGAVARLAISAGYDVVLSNSRGPQTLGALVSELGPHARAAEVAEAAADADIVVVSIPFGAYRELPAEPLAGKVVLDTTNYYPGRDGQIAGLDDGTTTTGELLQAHLPGSHVVKAFNTIFYKHIPALARPHGATDRSALPVVGDEASAKATATALLDAIGYDAYDAGPLREGRRLQVDRYAYGVDGSYEQPAPVGVEQLGQLLAQAR